MMFLIALKFTTGDREGWSSQSISPLFPFLNLKQSKSYPDFILSLGGGTFCSRFSQYHKLKLLLKQNKAKFFKFSYKQILCAYFQKWFVLLVPFLFVKTNHFYFYYTFQSFVPSQVFVKAIIQIQCLIHLGWEKYGNNVKLWQKQYKNIYFCFTDYTKAFDCMDHNKLWKNS